MLSKQAIESAVPLLDILDGSKLFLVPKSGTVLEALVQATRVPLNPSEPQYVPSLDDIEYMANARDEATGFNQHDCVSDEVSAVGIASVQSFLAHCKTVVAPVVLDLVNKVKTDLAAAPAGLLAGMEVIPVLAPEVLYNNSFVKEVMKFQDVPYDEPDLAMRLPMLSTTDIRELMKIGGGQVEDQINQWLAAKGDNFLIDVWENIFQIKQLVLAESGSKVTFASLLTDPEHGRDRAIAVFLIARRLSDAGAPDSTDMSAAQFSRFINSYRDQAALILCREIEKLELRAKQGRLILRSEDKRVWVDSKLYDEWLAAGGSIEILYGNTLDGNVRVTVQDINDAATSLLDAWNKHHLVVSQIEEGKTFVRTKSLILGHFRASLKDMSPEELAKTNANDVMKVFAEELNRTRPSDIENLHNLCLRLVCRSRFFYTDAEKLLGQADDIMKANPGVTDREAFGMATTQYVIDWLCEMFEVRSNA